MDNSNMTETASFLQWALNIVLGVVAFMGKIWVDTIINRVKTVEDHQREQEKNLVAVKVDYVPKVDLTAMKNELMVRFDRLEERLEHNDIRHNGR